MGTAACQAIDAAEDMELCGQTGRGDDLRQALQAGRPRVLVEFTAPDAVAANLRVALEEGVHVVSGTTGLAESQARELGELAAERHLGCLIAPNFCLGVLLMQDFAARATRWFDDVEILEMHHEKKLDAPSGTALSTAKLIAGAAKAELNQGRPETREVLSGVRGGCEGEIPIHSIRLPGLLAHQEILFGATGQVLSIRHDCLDREAFMPGILLGIRRIGASRGLVDSLAEFLDESPD
jgi:4-hydroxy-tetrahydrodipicolinate reductase